MATQTTEPSQRPSLSRTRKLVAIAAVVAIVVLTAIATGVDRSGRDGSPFGGLAFLVGVGLVWALWPYGWWRAIGMAFLYWLAATLLGSLLG